MLKAITGTFYSFSNPVHVFLQVAAQGTNVISFPVFIPGDVISVFNLPMRRYWYYSEEIYAYMGLRPLAKSKST